MHNKTGGHTHKLIDTSHFVGTDTGKIVVDRDDMNALACKRVEICGESCHKRFAFTGFHFGNTSLVKNDTAKHLHAEGAFTEYAVVCLANSGKSLGQNIIQGFSCGKTVAEYLCHALQFGIAHCTVCIGKSVDLVGNQLQFFELTLAVSAKNFCYE